MLNKVTVFGPCGQATLIPISDGLSVLPVLYSVKALNIVKTMYIHRCRNCLTLREPDTVWAQTEPTLRRVFSPQFPASDERIGAEMDCVLQSLSSVSPESVVYQHVIMQISCLSFPAPGSLH